MKEGLLPTDVSLCKSFPVELSDSEGGDGEGRGEAPGHPLLVHTRPGTRHQGVINTVDRGWYTYTLELNSCSLLRLARASTLVRWQPGEMVTASSPRVTQVLFR